ncbi:MAG: transporter substrate-binding domain-containing protein [Paludibacter sp.]
MYYKKIIFQVLLCVVVLLSACVGSNSNDRELMQDVDLETILQNDTLRIGTIAGPISYFNFRDEVMGFDYELAQNLADSLKVNLKIVEVENENELTTMLDNNEIDIAAYNFQQTKPLKKKYNFVLPLDDSYMVLVQPLNIKTISNTIDLKAKTITVVGGSAQEQRLQNLNNENGL